MILLTNMTTFPLTLCHYRSGFLFWLLLNSNYNCSNDTESTVYTIYILKIWFGLIHDKFVVMFLAVQYVIKYLGWWFVENSPSYCPRERVNAVNVYCCGVCNIEYLGLDDY